MDFNKLTIKSQEAVAAAQELARRNGNPELYPEHLLARAARPGAAARARARRGRAARAGRGDARREAAHPGRAAAAERVGAFSKVLDKAFDEAKRMQDDYVSTEHLLLALDVVPREQLEAKIAAVRGGQRVTSQDPEGTYQALAKFGRDLTEAAEAGQARPGHRPRRGDPPRHPGALAPHEEQPRADRRARHRQDGDRRRARAAHRRRRRARGPEGQARVGARHRRRCSPARSTAASSRSG